MRGNEAEAKRAEPLGRDRAQLHDRQRHRVGPVEDLEARALEPRQLREPRAIRRARVRRQKRRQARARLAQRRMRRRAGMQVVGDEVVERVAPEQRRRPRQLLAQHVVDPHEVHARRRRRAGRSPKPRVARHHRVDRSARPPRRAPRWSRRPRARSRAHGSSACVSASFTPRPPPRRCRPPAAPPPPARRAAGCRRRVRAASHCAPKRRDRAAIERPDVVAYRVIVRVEQVRPLVAVPREVELPDAIARNAVDERDGIEAVVARADEDVVHVEQQPAVGALGQRARGTPTRSSSNAGTSDSWRRSRPGSGARAAPARAPPATRRAQAPPRCKEGARGRARSARRSSPSRGGPKSRPARPRARQRRQRVEVPIVERIDRPERQRHPVQYDGIALAHRRAARAADCRPRP